MKKPRVWIYEQDDFVREKLRRFLSILLPNCEISEFIDMKICLSALWKYAPDLLLVSDDSRQILAEFPRERRRFRAIALVDGRSDRAWRAAIDAGADDVVTTPFDDLILKSKVETLLSGSYSSSYSFFAAPERGMRLAPITLGLDATIFEINEARVELLSGAFLKTGVRLRIRWAGLELAATVERCRPNMNRPGTFFAGARLELADEQQASALRRQLILNSGQ